MSPNLLTDLLIKFGGPALAGAIGAEFGDPAGRLATAALDALGRAFGVEPHPDAISKRIETVAAEDPDKALGAVTWAESQVAPRLLAEAQVWKESAAQQQATNELLMAEQKEGGPAAAWLWLWQYVLIGFWTWSILLVPLGNALLRIAGQPAALVAPDLTILMTLTGAYLALHMGGHTVLELMRGGAIGGGSDTKGKS